MVFRLRFRSAAVLRTFDVSDDCIICLGTREYPVFTGCGHLFCGECIFQLVVIQHNQNETVKCPYCRKKVVELHANFLDDPNCSDQLKRIVLINKIEEFNCAQRQSELANNVLRRAHRFVVDLLQWAYRYVANLLRWAFRLDMALPDEDHAELPEDRLDFAHLTAYRFVANLLRWAFRLAMALPDEDQAELPEDRLDFAHLIVTRVMYWFSAMCIMVILLIVVVVAI